MRPRTRLIILFGAAPLIAFTLLGGLLGNAAVARDDTYRHLRIFEDVVSLITKSYVEAVNLPDVMRGALRGLSEGLDADSAFLTAEQVRQLESKNQPDVQVGLEVTRQFYIQGVAARDGSPAARAGLLDGDFIRAIDDQPTRLMSAFEGAQRLKGAEGSSVRLSILRGNSAEPQELTLIRERTTAPAVTARIHAGSIGYLRIAEFSPDVVERMTSAVDDLRREGAARLVIDVRGSAFGSFDAGLAAARLFVPSGTLVVREETGPKKLPVEAKRGDGAIQMPAVLLVNNGTSGPGELFAAALMDTKRAESIGLATAGRTGVQKLVRLPDGSALWLTWGRYLTAAGRPIHRTGLEPAIVVDEPVPELGQPLPKEDPVLERALQHPAK
jgi:carboxyl-terminal processing protease